MADFHFPLKRIGVFTSGGDAPGMNAAIRACVRVGISRGLEVVGIAQGYQGILDSNFTPLQLRSVANILQRGGTVLKTGRCLEFLKPEARARAAQNLKAAGIDGLVCIGGNGSYEGAHRLWLEQEVATVGIPGTIDNDIWGTDRTIGFDTAVNTALDAIDRIRDTAASHDRLFIVEVMGRDSGFIAVDVAVAGGAEEVFIPDSVVSIDRAVEHIRNGMTKGKRSSILIAAEGQKPGRAYDLAEAIRKKANLDAKVCILGHVQRGGSPTAADRIIASRLASAAIDTLLKGVCDVALGTDGDRLTMVNLEDAYKLKKSTPKDLVELAQVLSI